MKLIYISFLCTLTIGLGACHSPQSKDTTREASVFKQQSVKEPQRMALSDSKEIIEYDGKRFQSRVVRRPDETLPKVKNDEGIIFVDNVITLQLTCAGRTVIDKKFTKQDFISLIEASFLKNAILEGIVYDRTTSQGIQYAASVGYPETDLYQPIRLTVSPSGKLSMVKEEQMVEVAEEE
ncbi:MAG: DUF4738 domain-containing protein [Mediterranea massiliensis]|nr:DUF4738 domain-containing protein [Mediterranea massiliensis]